MKKPIKNSSKSGDVRKLVFFVWEDKEGFWTGQMTKLPLHRSWKVHLEANERIWKSLVRRGVIV